MALEDARDKFQETGLMILKYQRVVEIYFVSVGNLQTQRLTRSGIAPAYYWLYPAYRHMQEIYLRKSSSCWK